MIPMHCDTCGRVNYEPLAGQQLRYDVTTLSTWLVRTEVLAPGDVTLGAPAYVRVEHVCPGCQREQISAAPKMRAAVST